MLDPAISERATKELARYIGPVAKIIVAQAAKSCESTKELLDVLSQELPTAKDQEEFRAAITRHQ